MLLTDRLVVAGVVLFGHRFDSSSAVSLQASVVMEPANQRPRLPPPPPPNTHTQSRTRAHTRTHTHASIRTRARMYVRTHTHIQAFTRARAHVSYARKLSRAHTITHTHARVRAHLHTHTHPQTLAGMSGRRRRAALPSPTSGRIDLA